MLPDGDRGMKRLGRKIWEKMWWKLEKMPILKIYKRDNIEGVKEKEDSKNYRNLRYRFETCTVGHAQVGRGLGVKPEQLFACVFLFLASFFLC